MTELDAVNQMLEWIGEPAVSAITISGNDVTNEAQTVLHRESRSIQSRGWACNTLKNLELAIPDVRIAGAAGTGTFTFNELVTQATSGATGYFRYIESGYIYLVAVSGTFVNTKTLTGGASGATWIGTTYAAQTTGKLALSTDVLKIEPSAEACESTKFVQRGTFLYNPVDATFVFTDSVHVLVIGLLTFTDLTDAMAQYVAKTAAASFYAFKLRNSPLSLIRVAELSTAKMRALQENADLLNLNLTQTADAMAVKGWRLPSALVGLA